MKKILILLLLVMFSQNIYPQSAPRSAAPLSPNKVETVKDITITYLNSRIKISPKSSFVLEEFENNEDLGLSLDISIDIEGSKIMTPEEVYLVLYSNNKFFRFQTIASRSISLLNTNRKTTASFILLEKYKNQSFAHEVIAGEFPYTAFKKFTEADNGSIKMGGKIIKLDKDQVQTLKNLINVIENQK